MSAGRPTGTAISVHSRRGRLPGSLAAFGATRARHGTICSGSGRTNWPPVPVPRRGRKVHPVRAGPVEKRHRTAGLMVRPGTGELSTRTSGLTGRWRTGQGRPHQVSVPGVIFPQHIAPTDTAIVASDSGGGKAPP